MLILDIVNGMDGLIDDKKSPKAAIIIKAVNKAIEQNKDNLKDPESWKRQRDIVVLIMSRIPALVPYSVIAYGIFEIIIQIVELEENVSTN